MKPGSEIAPPIPIDHVFSETRFQPSMGFQTSLKIATTKMNEVESEDYYLSEKSFKEEIQQISGYLSEFKRPKITTPFKGTSLVMSKDKTKFYFGSREGRIGAARIETKETIGDIDLKEGTIWTIALSNNDKFLYSGGQGGEIKKFLVSNMTQVNVFKGHTDEVNVILISKDEKKMYSTADDGKVIMWDLTVADGNPKILYEIRGICYGLDLSADNLFVASVGQDSSLNYYDLAKQEKVKVLKENDFSITWCVSITNKNTFVAFGDQAGTTFLYTVKTWERARVFNGHSQRVRCMASTSDEKYLITGGIDNKIFIWDLCETRNGIELLGHDDWVKAILIADDQKTFYSMSDDCSIHTWKIPKYDNYVILKKNLEVAKYDKMLTGHRSGEYIFLMSKDAITKLDRSNDLQESVMNMEDLKVKRFCISPVDDKIVTARLEVDRGYEYKKTSKKYIFEFYDSEFMKLKEQSMDFYDLSSMIFSADGKFLIMGEMFKVVIVNEDSFEIYKEFRSHKGSVTNLACSPKMKYVFSFDDNPSSYMVKTYDFYEQIELKTLYDPNFQSVVELEISADEEYLIVVPENRQATIWATSKMIKIVGLDIESCTDIMFHSHYNHLYCLFPEYIKTYTIPSLCVSFIVKFRTAAKIFTFNYNSAEIIVGLESSIEVWKTPTAVTSLALYGENKILYEFYKYTANLVSGKAVKYNPNFNHWIIEPFHMNILHIYAYFNKVDYLKLAIDDNAGFLASRSGFTPLDVCFEMNNETGIDYFFDYISKISKTKPYFTCVLGRSLNRILRHQSFMTTRFLDIMLTRSLDTTLTRFHHTTVDLPIIVFSPTVFCNKSSFAKENFSNEGQAAEFLQTYFKFNVSTGSQDSIDFINSLLDTENDQVFTSDFIQTVLQLKWKKIRMLLYIQASVFVVYLVLLSAYTDNGNFGVLTACFAVNVVLVLYEVVQFLCSGEDYFKDLWNYIDIIRSALMTLVWIRDLANIFPLSDNLVALVVFISWVRGVSYFRVIESTRYYINLIYEVIWDTTPFLTIFFYSTFAFSLVYERLLDRNGDYWSFLTNAWEVNQGGFTTTAYGGWMYLAFFVDCIINPVILLSLLISIMGDTFQRVNSNIMVADSRELAEMILEGELIYFWKRKEKAASFLHICKSLDLATERDEIKKMKIKVSELTEIAEKIFEDTKVMKEEQEEIRNLIENMSN